ncbi:MAG: hypothetical protein JSS01_07270 [Proteobacteria bacterium]|nr:hypothetical protein [Pseudomonadota bacterium]
MAGIIDRAPKAAFVGAKRAAREKVAPKTFLRENPSYTSGFAAMHQPPRTAIAAAGEIKISHLELQEG